MKQIIENLTENSRHAEFDSASQVTPSSDTSCHLLPPTGRRQFSLAFTLAEVFSPCRKTKLNFGFTLAETLITLGVIGVVAALVVPGVVNGFKRKQLETAFKKADSVITTAMQATMFEHGLTNYYDFGKRYCNENCSAATSDFDDFKATFKEQFRGNIVKDITASDFTYTAKKCNFLGTSCNLGWYSNSFSYYGVNIKGFILKNGMLISMNNDANNASPIGIGGHKWTIVPYVFFDTNGPYKGPNREGYDIFHYTKMTFYATSCKPLSTDHRNMGCYLWAMKDENPYDSSISYWEGLYKPKSWWENVRNNSKK